MSRDVWYYSRDGEEKMGPTPGDHLRAWIGAGHLTGEHLVWRSGLAEWTPIRHVPELQSAEPSSATPNAGAEAKGPDTQFLLTAVAWVKKSMSRRSLLSQASLKILMIFVVAPFTVFKTLVVPSMVSSATAVLAERYGVEMSVEDWSANLLDLSAAAENVVILIPGPYAEKEFVSAEEVEVDLSLLSGLLDGQWVREIRVKKPKIYLERLLAGRWNWEDLMATPISPPIPSVIHARTSRSEPEPPESSFVLPSLSIEGMRLKWVENLPGDSQSGMIQELKTTLFIDDISVNAKNLVGLLDPSSQPNSLLSLEARTGSGKISFSGRANFFSWAISEHEQQANAMDWMPNLEGRIYLENVGSNAFARLVPDAAIMPQGGTMTGNIELGLADRQVVCQANLNIRNATFNVNQTSGFVPRDSSKLEAQLSGYQANGQYQFSCGGHLGEGTYRPLQAFQTNVIRQGVSRASKTVQTLAAVEHVRYSDDPIDPSLESEATEVLGRANPEWLKWVGLAVTVDSSLRDSGRGGILSRLKNPFKL